VDFRISVSVAQAIPIHERKNFKNEGGVAGADDNALVRRAIVKTVAVSGFKRIGIPGQELQSVSPTVILFCLK